MKDTNGLDRDDIDRHLTGNGGEDQYDYDTLAAEQWADEMGAAELDAYEALDEAAAERAAEADRADDDAGGDGEFPF